MNEDNYNEEVTHTPADTSDNGEPAEVSIESPDTLEENGDNTATDDIPVAKYISNEEKTPAKPVEKEKSPTTLVVIVLVLAAVIIGMIVFIVVTLAKSDNDKKDQSGNKPTGTTAESGSTPAPTNIVIDIDVTPEPSVTVTPDPENTAAPTTAPEPTGTDDPNVTPDADVTPDPTVTEEPTPFVEPPFKVTTIIGQYKGVEVDYDLPEVTEEDVEAAVEYFRSSLEEEQPIGDRPLKEGDIVVVDYKGTINGESFEGGEATGDKFELGSNMFIEGFEEGLIGKKVGDTVSLDLTFPDYYSEDVAGKDVNFVITINEAYEYVAPELTDELVAANSTCTTVQEYIDSARETLKKQAKEMADSQMKSDIIQKIIDDTVFSGQIDEQIAYEEQDAKDYYDYMAMQSFGVDGATYFGYIWGITQEEYYAMLHNEVEMSVKYNYVLDEIVKTENLTFTEEEYKETFEETFFENYGFTSEEEIYGRISEKEAREIIEGYILHDKAEALIMESAVVHNRPEE